MYHTLGGPIPREPTPDSWIDTGSLSSYYKAVLSWAHLPLSPHTGKETFQVFLAENPWGLEIRDFETS